MDPYDQALLEHTLRWCNYGGGDEHIFPEFGTAPALVDTRGVQFQAACAV